MRPRHTLLHPTRFLIGTNKRSFQVVQELGQRSFLMRLFFPFAALSLAALGVAQVPGEAHEKTVWEAYQNLRTNKTFVFDMRGREVYGKNEVLTHAILSWRRSYDRRTGLDSKVQVSLNIFDVTPKEEVLRMRIVGDGTTLYRYDMIRKEVVTTTYGFFSDRAPDNYANTVRSDGPKLLSQLRVAAPGLASYLVRLVAEINPSGSDFAAKHSSWVPDYPVLNDPAVPGGRKMYNYFDEILSPLRQTNNPEVPDDDIVTDPISGQPFLRGKDQYVFYGYGKANPERTVAFSLYDADSSEESQRWEVRQVNVASKTPNRFFELVITPNVVSNLSDEVFLPIGGAYGAAFRPVTRGN